MTTLRPSDCGACRACFQRRRLLLTLTCCVQLILRREMAVRDVCEQPPLDATERSRSAHTRIRKCQSPRAKFRDSAVRPTRGCGVEVLRLLPSLVVAPALRAPPRPHLPQRSAAPSPPSFVLTCAALNRLTAQSFALPQLPAPLHDAHHEVA
jgi:hypothetical protein